MGSDSEIFLGLSVLVALGRFADFALNPSHAGEASVSVPLQGEISGHAEAEAHATLASGSDIPGKAGSQSFTYLALVRSEAFFQYLIGDDRLEAAADAGLDAAADRKASTDLGKLFGG